MVALVYSGLPAPSGPALLPMTGRLCSLLPSVPHPRRGSLSSWHSWLPAGCTDFSPQRSDGCSFCRQLVNRSRARQINPQSTPVTACTALLGTRLAAIWLASVLLPLAGFWMLPARPALATSRAVTPTSRHQRALAEGTLETSRALRVKTGISARVSGFSGAPQRGTAGTKFVKDTPAPGQP